MEQDKKTEEKEIREMIEYYRSGKRMFWVLIWIGMAAGAITAIIVLFRQFKN